MAADLVAGRIDALIAEDSNFTGYLAENPDLPIENVPEYVPQSDLSDWTRFGTRASATTKFNNVFSRAVNRDADPLEDVGDTAEVRAGG